MKTGWAGVKLLYEAAYIEVTFFARFARPFCQVTYARVQTTPCCMYCPELLDEAPVLQALRCDLHAPRARL